MAQNAYLFLKIDGADVDTQAQIETAAQDDSFDFSNGRGDDAYVYEFKKVYVSSFDVNAGGNDASSKGAEQHYFTVELEDATISESQSDGFDFGV